jgi:predicted dinucleotide-binding enzyme
MLIGILGAGEVALAFSRYALRAGHQVRLSNSRGPESLKDVVKELGTGASAGTIREAAQAPIVLIAIPWPKVDEVLKSLPDKWENRILIDATNHFLLPSMEIAVIDLGSLHDGGRMQQLEGPLAGLDLAQIDD